MEQQEEEKSSVRQEETLLASNPDRFVLIPDEDDESKGVKDPIWIMYKKAVASFWTPEEIDLEKDKNDWNALTTNEQYFVKHILAFFASSDGIVNENLALNFASEVQISTARAFYAFQMAIENIHSEVYALLINTFVRDKEERKTLFHAIENFPAIGRKATWAMKYTDKKVASFAARLVAFAAVEGIFFSGSFCAIFWLKKRGLMPGLTFSNELISRDEGLHCEFASLMYSRLEHRLSEEEALSIVKEAVSIECEFVSEAIPVSLIGMNAPSMVDYIKFVADRLVWSLGYKTKPFNVKNPFEWMDLISLNGKTNFFEKRVGEYSKANVGASKEDRMFTLDADF